MYKALIGKREEPCGHEHRTIAAAKKCGEKLAGGNNDKGVAGLLDSPGSYKIVKF